MRLRNLFLFQGILLLLPLFAISQKHSDKDFVAMEIIKNTEYLPDDIKQLLVVYNESPEDHQAVLAAMEKTDKGWQEVIKAIPAGVGRNGFAKPGKKVEGDGKSPTGLYRLGSLFSYKKLVETNMPYFQTTKEDKWIDDPESVDYNRHVSGETKAKSYEKLKLDNDLYKYCMVIEYNTNPIVKGKGSAIFLHLSEDPPGATSGCVAITENNMEWILKWMNPELNPSIIMGNKQTLIAGLNQ